LDDNFVGGVFSFLYRYTLFGKVDVFT